MLNKDLCKKCRKKSSWWNSYDDKRWDEGTIICVLDRGGRSFKKRYCISNGYPSSCPYSLEHLVETQTVNYGGKNGH